MKVSELPKPPLGEPIEGIATAKWVSSHTLDQSGRAWLAAALPIVMRTGQSVTFADPQDEQGVANSYRVQEIYDKWWSWISPVPVFATTTRPHYPQNRGVGCFFSGGADSFHSLLTNLEEVTHLIFVDQGFDIAGKNKELAESARRAVEDTARKLGKELIVIRTDVRKLSNRYAGWGARYHGAALATVAQLLSPHLSKVLIPSSSHFDDLHPWGTHPDLDPYWSTSYTKLVHDGVMSHRHEKMKIISESDVALQHLRVCFKNIDGEYNCGRCEKCLRTMIPLYAYGRLTEAQTFPGEIDIELLAATKHTKVSRRYAQHNLDLLQKFKSADDPVATALRRCCGA